MDNSDASLLTLARNSLHSIGGRPFTRGVFLIITAIFLFDVQGAMIKHMGHQYPVSQIAIFRNLMGLLPSLLVLYLSQDWIDSGRPWKTARQTLSVLRGCMIVLAQLSFYFSLSKMELATATTLAFAGPLFVTSLAVPILAHRVGLWRATAVVIGFVGVVSIIRPGLDDFSVYSILPVMAAFFYALASVSAKLFPKSDQTGLINLYASLTAMLLMILLTLVTRSWVTVGSLVDWCWLLSMGLVGGVAALLMITAYRMTEPASLSPFEYFGIPFSFILGWVFFGEAPFRQLFPGVLLIVAAGLLVAWRERKQMAPA